MAEPCLDAGDRLGGELGGLVMSYKPLVKATAYRYMGRGAEFDDLVQEGYLALLLLIPRCEDRQWLAAFLKERLPGYVRTAAARLRYGDEVCELEEIEEIVRDVKSGYERSRGELRYMLEQTLSAEELDLTQALLEGFTQKEIAALHGITQQAVGARLRKIREKLKPLVHCK